MDNRILLYVALALISFLMYTTYIQTYHAPPPSTVVETGTVPGSAEQPSAIPDGSAPAADLPVVSGPAALPSTGSDVSAAETRVSVQTGIMDITLSSIGGTIAKVNLLDYPVSHKQPDEPFSLLNDDPLDLMVAESGLQSSKGVAAPTHKVPLSTAASEYIMDDSGVIKVPFTWQSETGVNVTKTFTFTADSYVVDVDYVINNQSAEPYRVNQYRQIKRKPGTKDEKQQFINTYIGAVVSNTEDVYQKVDFGDIEDERFNEDVTDGWVAMIEHYFAAAWVKIQENLSAVADKLELTVDFGFLTILAQPLFWLLKTIQSYVSNWGWAIVLTVVVIKAILYPLSERAYKSMARMKNLQPKLASLKERHGDDRAKMGQATMELYKKEKVNPLGGCLPMLIQMPIFIALYWALIESVELRQAPWILWIQDLSIRDPLFILPVLMAVTMFVQQKLSPAPVDPIQAKVMQFLPLIFGAFFALFPAGLVLYWVVNNALSIAQQYYITRIVIGDTPKK